MNLLSSLLFAIGTIEWILMALDSPEKWYSYPLIFISVIGMFYFADKFDKQLQKP